jgi:hypothetical protein
MLDCKRCLDFGHRCGATHETEASDPSCVFCLDGVSCPVRRRQERSDSQKKTQTSVQRDPDATVKSSGSVAALTGASRVRTKDAERETESESKMETTTQTHQPVSVRICNRPGCTIELGPLNRSGRCTRHFHWKATGKGRSSADNGHLAARSDGDVGYARKTRSGNGSRPAVNVGDGANGRATRTGTVPGLAGNVIEERLNRLITGFTMADKAKIATAWLKGEI